MTFYNPLFNLNTANCAIVKTGYSTHTETLETQIYISYSAYFTSIIDYEKVQKHRCTKGEHHIKYFSCDA